MPVDHGKMVVSFIDQTRESSRVTVIGEVIDETNYVAMQGYFSAAKTAIKALMVDPVETVDQRVYLVDTNANPIPPTDTDAQRETKGMILGHDTITGSRRRIEVPCFNLALLDPEGTGKIPTDAAEYIALKAALDAVWRNKETGNLIAVDGVWHVGRNL